MYTAPGEEPLPDNDAVWLADNMDVLPGLPSEAFQLIYIDPPFNTGKVQARKKPLSGLGSGRRSHGLWGAALQDAVARRVFLSRCFR